MTKEEHQAYYAKREQEVKMEGLKKYNNTTSRIVLATGEVFSGACEWFSRDYCLCEFCRDEEGLRICGHMLFKSDISEIEVLRTEVCIPVRDWPEAKVEIAAWFHERWHIPMEAYLESISGCLGNTKGAPQWYVVLSGDRIVAGCGVIENDFHERKDLAPNVCAVFVDEEYRNKGIAGFMLRYVCDDMSHLGTDTMYLLTDHTGLYERYGWKFLCMVRDNSGGLSRMYVHHTKKQ